MISTAFGCPYEGEVPLARVMETGERLLESGCAGVGFGDTTGMATPTRVRDLLRAWSGPSPQLHFHNTRGAGLANVLAALEEGMAGFDASVGGLGGCPYAPGATGNICTEDLVHMLEDMGVRTGVDLGRLISAACLAEEIVGRELPGQVMKAGPRTRTVPA
jgi:hydroxymethylglutaryl-CoA lyase